MSNIVSKDIAIEFCKLSDWAYECWITHRNLFDDNRDHENTIGKSKYFTQRLSIITQEYCLLQISKLHDPAIMRNSLNLTIEYIVRFGCWGQDEKKVSSLQNQLSGLWSNIKVARNKSLAHNDLETIMNNAAHGQFTKDLDVKYFEALQELVNMVHEKWHSEPYPFNDLAQADVEEFLNVLSKD